MTLKKGRFICITGIDGSGKSTQAERLISGCAQQGIQLGYVYGKIVPVVMKPVLVLGHFLTLRNYREDKRYPEYKSRKQSLIKKHPLISSLFYSLLLFEYRIQLFFKISVPLFLKKNIICDRYVFDTIITDIAVDRQYSPDDIFRSMDRLLKKFPEPDMVFLIDVPEEVAFGRKNDIASIDYLKERRQIYLAAADRYNMIIIDGRDPADMVESEIFHNVSSLFGR